MAKSTVSFRKSSWICKRKKCIVTEFDPWDTLDSSLIQLLLCVLYLCVLLLPYFSKIFYKRFLPAALQEFLQVGVLNSFNILVFLAF